MAEQAGGAGRAAGGHIWTWFCCGVVVALNPGKSKVQEASLEHSGPQEAHLDAQVREQKLTDPYTTATFVPGPVLAQSRYQSPFVELMVSLVNPQRMCCQGYNPVPVPPSGALVPRYIVSDYKHLSSLSWLGLSISHSPRHAGPIAVTMALTAGLLYCVANTHC